LRRPGCSEGMKVAKSQEIGSRGPPLSGSRTGSPGRRGGAAASWGHREKGNV